MSDPSNFLSALREAFKELDHASARAAESIAPELPAPPPPAMILERIRQLEATPANISPFRPIQKFESEECRLAARRGQEIDPAILKKMEKNRKA